MVMFTKKTHPQIVPSGTPNCNQGTKTFLSLKVSFDILSSRKYMLWNTKLFFLTKIAFTEFVLVTCPFVEIKLPFYDTLFMGFNQAKYLYFTPSHVHVHGKCFRFSAENCIILTMRGVITQCVSWDCYGNVCPLLLKLRHSWPTEEPFLHLPLNKLHNCEKCVLLDVWKCPFKTLPTVEIQ